MDFKGKRIIIGITSSIAAYKAAFLVRELVKSNAEVQVIMTKDATAFVTPLTLSTLSKRPVYIDFFKPENGEWTNHVELGLWADIMLIAPATANTLAKMATGICDNLLLATYLSAKCPVFFAPAMDLDMYAHLTTKDNIQTLINHGNHLIPAVNGELASGLYGEGRMAEPADILNILQNYFNPTLKGKHILVTAGPTYEKIDPVRFIGNFSSGKMGFAIAQAFAEKGAIVNLVSGTTGIKANHANIKVHSIVSADEMFDKCMKLLSKSDYIVMSAAVADFKPKSIAKIKIKKEKSDFDTIELIPNKDILFEMGKKKTTKQILVGFALEDRNEIANAKAKIKKKNLDFIVLNSMNDKGAGFGSDTNKVTLIDKKSKTIELPLASKNEIARQLVELITQ
ncbi:MAG: bifunctional phosphopantothenoylcysteine decarboxylase/phosphopantothenate--cysteine ligase CoaBC [Bacteroidia bacterium]|nr:bifunctional phosphopantothenoylcysteine decarboxylase/phosphopantothenate--cysteine ligase CoaBC [Bacteroidia bacterium]MCO5253053.1 bifunctional phosphopantothenoylcysteine decarboxylase/phosphopantothenate--cysteine ligase CoaBC [Bacteroidota bacterium]